MWSLPGVHQESRYCIWSLPGVQTQSQEFTWSPDGVHQDPWGSVTYRLSVCHRCPPHIKNEYAAQRQTGFHAQWLVCSKQAKIFSGNEFPRKPPGVSELAKRDETSAYWA